MKEFVIVSHVMLANAQGDLVQSEMPGIYIKVSKADGNKCPRCWQWDSTDHEYNLCSRCFKIVSG